MKELQRKKHSPKDLIIYEDEAILVCHKPCGLAVQTKQVAQKDLESIMKTYISAQTAPYLALINRIDQPVEGIVLFAKTSHAAAVLTSQLTEHTFEKEYLAITSPPPAVSEQTLIDYLIRDSRQNRSFVMNDTTENSTLQPKAKRAKLHYQTLQTQENQALLKIQLETGRHHQIRVQLANQNTPLLGDTKYGGAPNAFLCLCAHRLAFLHPLTKTPVEFCITPKNPAFSRYLL